MRRGQYYTVLPSVVLKLCKQTDSAYFQAAFYGMKFNSRTILFILIGLCAFALGMKQLREPDIWWQLLSGRWMLEHGAITHSDVFSYTMTGKPWINVKWLYEVVIALFEKALGPECVLLLQSIINLAIIVLLYRTSTLFNKHQQRGEPLPIFAIAISLLTFLAINEYRMAGRPEMISHLMTAVYMFILWRNPNFDLKKIWVLIPLQCIWANMHEGYPVGIVIIGAAVAGGVISYLLNKEKTSLQYTIRALALFVACILVVLLNPNGILLWKQPFEIYRQVWANKYTTELYSYKDVQYWTIQAKWHIGLIVLVAAYWAIQILNAIKTKRTRDYLTPLTMVYLLIIVLFVYLSLTANRNIPFAQIALLPSVPAALHWFWQLSKLGSISIGKILEKRALFIVLAITLLFYGSIVSNAFYRYTSSPNKYGIHVSMLHNPTGAAAFIKEHRIKGPAFSDYFISSYLLWSNYPEFKSYIDLRDLDVFPATFFDDYFRMYERPERFQQIDSQYHFNYVVVSTSQLQALQLKLYWGEGYNLLYVDPVAAIFLKQNDVNASMNNDLSLQKMYNWPSAIEDRAWATGLNKILNPTINYSDEDEDRQAIHAARFYSMIKNYDAAIKQLLPQMGNYENDAEAYSTLGSVYMNYADVSKSPAEKARRLDSAATYLEQAQQIAPNNMQTLSALGALSMARGDYEAASGYYKKYLGTNRFDDYAYYIYGLCNRQLMKNTGNEHYAKTAVAAMKNAATLNPQNGKAYLYMAECYMTLDEKEDARSSLQQAIESGNMWTSNEKQLLTMLKAQLGFVN